MLSKHLAAVVLLLVLGLLGMPPTLAQGGTIVSLADRNSTLECDLESNWGLKDWKVEGIDQLYRQWFWYRIGPSGGESPIHTLGLIGYKLSDNDWDAGNEHLTALYGNSDRLTAELSFTLAGGSPGCLRSDIAETITITNHGDKAVDFHFFQYCDLDLGDTKYDLSAAILGGNTAQQTSQGIWASETVVTPLPSHREVSYFADLWNRLNDGNPTTLNDQSGPIISGDMVWGFQWDCPLAPGDTLIISKNKTIVPEPATLTLLGLGATALVPRRVRKS